jgi:hypothetical protein
MAVPRLLIDNDVFILLAGSELLEEAARILGLDLAEARRLQSLPFIVRRNQARGRLPAAVADAVLSMCARIPVLDEEPEIERLQALSDVQAIDPGEAVLFAVLAQQPVSLLITNDKRAVQTLAITPKLEVVRVAVAGRIITLETLLLALLERQTTLDLATALAPVLPLDTMLRVAFSEHSVTHPNQCREALEAYRAALEAVVGADFLWKGV